MYAAKLLSLGKSHIIILVLNGVKYTTLYFYTLKNVCFLGVV